MALDRSTSVRSTGPGSHRRAVAGVVVFGLLTWGFAWLLGRVYVCWAPGLADGSTVPPVAGFRKPYCTEDGPILDWLIAAGVLYGLPVVGLVVAARAAARGRWQRALLFALVGPAAVMALSLIARTLPPSM